MTKLTNVQISAQGSLTDAEWNDHKKARCCPNLHAQIGYSITAAVTLTEMCKAEMMDANAEVELSANVGLGCSGGDPMTYENCYCQNNHYECHWACAGGWGLDPTIANGCDGWGPWCGLEDKQCVNEICEEVIATDSNGNVIFEPTGSCLLEAEIGTDEPYKIMDSDLSDEERDADPEITAFPFAGKDITQVDFEAP